jgi:hypothetical protein
MTSTHVEVARKQSDTRTPTHAEDIYPAAASRPDVAIYG